jgi:putative radical SAM enzyme (TIGR03279 family)
MIQKGIRVLKVKRRSAAEHLGLKPGDTILTANGHEVEDEIALRFYLSEELIDLHIRRESGIEEHALMELPFGLDPGIYVEEFRTRCCNNACLFCFVDQLPSGVRPSLRVKDDDFRLSFLHGNYITLTNITNRELRRIIEQRLSPLYVSVHATDPELRARILGRKKPDDLNRKLAALVDGGIQIHAQIVLMPGINDERHLEKTVQDLFLLYPGIQSAAIVPVGLSDHGEPRKRLSPITPDFSRRLIRTAARWQKHFRDQTGRAFVYLADEFYIQGGIEIPEWDHYDDFAQIEDGVGMVRSFLDEFNAEWRRRKKSRSALNGTLVTGRLFAPILNRCVRLLNHKFGSRLRVRAIENSYLGKNITVAGLLSGQDILNGLERRTVGDFLIIPSEALSRGEEILVDGVSLTDLASRLEKPVHASGRTMSDFFRILFERL